MMLSGFSSFSLSKAGIRSSETKYCWGAYFQLREDIQFVFPYLNRIIPEARYVRQPLYLQFLYRHCFTTLY
ncbi:MAG: hypothetical protein WA151_01530, partial [Desulfatirhabdiaceae bacterium]